LSDRGERRHGWISQPCHKEDIKQINGEFFLTQNIGLYGGTFDPPHLGHLVSAQALAEALALDEVIFIPSGSPPHKKDRAITSGPRRMDMLRLAIADNPRFGTSDWELLQKAPTYTINTVLYFQKVYPAARLFWLVGADSLHDLPSWYEFERLIDQVEIATACRGGLDIEKILAGLKARLTNPQFEKLGQNLVKTPLLEIAAHEIREKVRSGKSIRYLVPPAVEQYIRQEGLYR
jgi:nicotinate-nucleotide adenylyltransferase